jgi:diacylglycerol O-acyltransferase / wax synthase
MATKPATRMGESDAFSWYMERDPLLRSTVVTVLLFDRRPDPVLVRDKAERASRTIPGLRHRITEAPLRLAPPRWTVDADFDLSWHVRRIEAPRPGTLGSVLELARIAGMTEFDRAHPLWEWTSIDGLERGRSAIVLKHHHSLMDGIGGMRLAAHLFDLEPGSPDPGPMPDAPEPEHLSTPALVADALSYDWQRLSNLATSQTSSVLGIVRRAARHPAEAAGRTVSTVRSIARMVRPVAETRSPLMTDRKLGRHYDALELPLDDLRRAARKVGVTLNDAFLGGVAGGLRRYHLRHDTSCEELRVTLPISIRRDDDPLAGNRITLMRVTVPASVVDPVDRMRAVHELVGRARTEPAIPFTNAVAAALNLLPPGFVGGMLKHVDLVVSDVPGLEQPLYVGDARVERFYPFGPTIGAAANVTLLSYRDTCGIGVNTDVGAVPDPDVLMDCLREDFEQILDLAGDHGSVRLPARLP